MMRPVQMITTIGEGCITYEVIDGDASLGDMGDARTIWVRTVDTDNPEHWFDSYLHEDIMDEQSMVVMELVKRGK